VQSVRDVQGVGVGDPFERLFTAEYATVVAIASRVLADAHEAEDVAQDVFVQFHRAYARDLRAGHTVPHARPWLHAAAVHTALTVVRGRRRRAQREKAEFGAHERLYDAGAPDPAHVIEREERQGEVRRALARLPQKSAAVLALRYSGLSYAETAAALGVNVGQIGTLLRRAEATLRKEMTL
jgi:RNA polymerase sigma factor (sigma-70 family)